MTAEIGILNRYGVALAADSAVTVGIDGKEKVLNSADKLFCLTSAQPVGIMVFGNGSFMGVPWEIIIKQYRKKIGSKGFPTLKEYCDNFFQYIISDTRYYTNQSTNVYIYRIFAAYLDEISTLLTEQLREKFPNYEPPENDILSFLLGILKDKNEELGQLSYVSDFIPKDIMLIKNNYKSIVLECFNGAFNLKISEEIEDQLTTLAGYAICKDTFENETGVVFAGYGDNDIFPELYRYNVEGIFNDKLKYKLVEESKIYAEDGQDQPTSSIMAFAQQEMVHSVLTGIDPELNSFIVNNFSGIFNGLGDIIDYIVRAAKQHAKA